MTSNPPKPKTYFETEIAKIIEQAMVAGAEWDDIPTAAAHYAAQIKRLAATPGR